MTNPHRQPVNPFTHHAEEMQSAVNEMQVRLKEQVIAVFANPLGLQLLDTLEDLYLRQKVCPPGCPEGYGYFREGQNSLILNFRSVVNQAQTQGKV